MKFLSTRVACERRSVGKSTHYSQIGKGLMTEPIRNGPRDSTWPDYEIEVINAAWAAGASEDEIRALVKELHAKRNDYFKDTLSAIGIDPSAITADSPGHGPADLHPA